jgi:hypothetical protein
MPEERFRGALNIYSTRSEAIGTETVCTAVLLATYGGAAFAKATDVT